MTVLEYDQVVKRLAELMSKTEFAEKEKSELESIMDSIDEYKSSEYLKAGEN